VKLREHKITLLGERVVLRPMTEADWPVLLRWNQDAEFLYWCEGEEVQARPLEDVQRIYRGVSQQAFCFMAECEGVAVAECWLQEMNLPRIVQRHPGWDLRRIDLAIGEKNLWGKGLGTQIIGLLTHFAFAEEGAEVVYGCDIMDINVRSIRAFEKNGYRIVEKREMPTGDKSSYCLDLCREREG